MVVLTSEEKESGCVSSGQIEHEHAFHFDKVAVFGCLGRILGVASRLIELKRHRHRVFILVLDDIGPIEAKIFHLVLVRPLQCIDLVEKRWADIVGDNIGTNEFYAS